MTTKPPFGLVAIVPAVGRVPSPQLIEAENCDAVAFGFSSVNVATVPLNCVPATALTWLPLALDKIPTDWTPRLFGRGQVGIR